MIELMQFNEDSDANNRLVQMALRDTDVVLLAKMLLACDEDECAIIRRNMSQRGWEELEQVKSRFEGTMKPAHGQKAKEVFLLSLKRYESYMGHKTSPNPEEIPSLRTETAEDIVSSIEALSHYFKAVGKLQAHTIEVLGSNPVAHKV